jgi:adenylate cyclase, class 1
MATLPDIRSIAETIKKNRDSFIAYNIAHLREVIRYLSTEKFELFHTLPFLLHVNSPEFPGYVADPDCKYGIHGFLDSGFWKLALKHFKFSEKKLFPCLAKKYHIQGLYLMGSSGTLAQGDHSDLDYWVLVDEEMNHDSQMDTLKQKLTLLKEWAGTTYTQQISFFILTSQQVKNNSFRQVDEESSGNIQQTILKEEFYRTFLMIAGMIPYWAVLPADLDENQYYLWIDKIENHGSMILDQNYTDLGYPAGIDKKECTGALLWQIFKARHDPVKSYIKASLIVYYYFSSRDAPLPCDEIKKKFSDKKLDSYMVDPYSTIFNKTLLFYQDRNEVSRLEMLRECLFLRINGYPIVKAMDKGSPKKELLQIYLKQWSWDEDKIEHFRNYPDWPEADKLDFEIRIISRISALYKKIQLAENEIQKPDTPELRSIQNRISTIFTTRPNKIPRCSAYIKAKAESGKLHLIFRCAKAEDSIWNVYEQQTIPPRKNQQKLYTGSGLSQLTGWLDVNRLALNPSKSIIMDMGDHSLSDRQAIIFIDKALHFLNAPLSNHEYTAARPSWNRILVAVESNPSGGNNRYERFDILIKNTWGEIFHHHLAIKDIENNLLKCYKLSNLLNLLTKDMPTDDPQYLIFELGAENETYAHKTTLEFIHQGGPKVSEKKSNIMKTDNPEGSAGSDPENPFLDLL